MGTLTSPKNGKIIDKWYKKLNQFAPKTPTIISIENSGENVLINTSQFDGADSLMSVQIQVIDSTKNSMVVFDTLIQKVNIYGVDSFSEPLDLNKDNNIYQTKIPNKFFKAESNYIKTRYRDNNLKWSDWSDNYLYISTGIYTISQNQNKNILFQNYPNPFSNYTTIKYYIESEDEITFRVYDINYKLILEKNEGLKTKGIYSLNFSVENLKCGLYFYEMISRNSSNIKSMIKIE